MGYSDETGWFPGQDGPRDDEDVPYEPDEIDIRLIAAYATHNEVQA